MYASRLAVVGLVASLVIVVMAPPAAAEYQMVYSVPIQLPSGALSPSCIGDFDGDGRLEVVGWQPGGFVQIKDVLSGIEEFAFLPPEASARNAHVHDLDGDGTPEILIETFQPGLVLVDFVGPTAVNDAPSESRAALSPPRPNPFNPVTMISASLASPGNVEVTVYDVSGRLVRHLAEGHREAGRADVQWDGADDSGRALASGAYFYELRVDGKRIETQKAVILR